MTASIAQHPRYFAKRLFFALVITVLAGCGGVSTVKDHTSVANYALSLKGAPYRYGKASPKEGFDCSGFVQHVYAQEGILLPRTVTQMAALLPHAAKHDLHTGDLVFFSFNRSKPSHVGLYLQDNQFIHAPSSRTGKVQISTLENNYWSERFFGARHPE